MACFSRAGPVLAVLILGCATSSSGRNAPPGTHLQPALIEWNVGVGDKDGPSALIETILPSTYRGRQIWRVVHRDADPTADGQANAYDLYDVAADTVVPLRSVMNREGFHLSLSFERDHVIIEKEEGGRRTRSEVRVPLLRAR